MNLKWRIAIRKDVTSGKFPHKKALWKPSIFSRVCGAHFNEEDFKSMYSITTTVRCDKENIIFFPIVVPHFQGAKRKYLRDDAMPSIFPWSISNASNSQEEATPSDHKKPSVVTSSSGYSTSVPNTNEAVELDVGRDDYVYQVQQEVEDPADDLPEESKWDEDYDPRPLKYRNWPGYAEHVYRETVKFWKKSGMDVPMRHMFARNKEGKIVFKSKLPAEEQGNEDLCSCKWDDHDDPRPQSIGREIQVNHAPGRAREEGSEEKECPLNMKVWSE